MVVAVAAKAKTVESEVDDRFCTAKCFLVVDTKTHEVEVIENGQGLESTPEVEDRAAEMMIDRDVDLVLADHYGPMALRALTKAGIETVGAIHGKVREVIGEYEEEDYECPINPDAEPWWNWR